MENELMQLYIKYGLDPQHYKGMTNDLFRLFNVKRTDSPKCTKCGADEDKQSCIGKWSDGEEYKCDECGNEWEFGHFDNL